MCCHGTAVAGIDGPYTDRRLARSAYLMMLEDAYGYGERDGRRVTAQQVASIESSAVKLVHAADTFTRSAGNIEDLAVGTVLAKSMVDLAGSVSNQRVRDAELEADAIVRAAQRKAIDEVTNYDRTMNERISCHMREEKITEVFRCLTPSGWDMDVDILNTELLNSLVSFTSDKPRRDAIADLVEQIRQQTRPSVRLFVNFYPRLRGSDGNQVPIVVFADKDGKE